MIAPRLRPPFPVGVRAVLALALALLAALLAASLARAAAVYGDVTGTSRVASLGNAFANGSVVDADANIACLRVYRGKVFLTYGNTATGNVTRVVYGDIATRAPGYLAFPDGADADSLPDPEERITQLHESNGELYVHSSDQRSNPAFYVVAPAAPGSSVLELRMTRVNGRSEHPRDTYAHGGYIWMQDFVSGSTAYPHLRRAPVNSPTSWTAYTQTPPAGYSDSNPYDVDTFFEAAGRLHTSTMFPAFSSSRPYILRWNETTGVFDTLYASPASLIPVAQRTNPITATTNNALPIRYPASYPMPGGATALVFSNILYTSSGSNSRGLYVHTDWGSGATAASYVPLPDLAGSTTAVHRMDAVAREGRVFVAAFTDSGAAVQVYELTDRSAPASTASWTYLFRYRATGLVSDSDIDYHHFDYAAGKFYFARSAAGSLTVSGGAGTILEVNAPPVGGAHAIAAPSAPQNFSASLLNDTVTFTWDTVSNATAYDLQRADTVGGAFATVVSDITGTTVTDSLPGYGLRRQYRLVAKNTGGASPASATLLVESRASQAVEVLGNPVGAKTGYARNIWDLQVFDGRLFVGYGNAANAGLNPNAGACAVVAFDPALNGFPDEGYTLLENQIDRFALYGSSLLAPGSEPASTDTPVTTGSVYTRAAGGAWSRRKNVPNATAVQDLRAFGGALFAATRANGAAASLLRSADDGASWTAAVSGAFPASFNALHEIGGALYASGYLAPGATNGIWKFNTTSNQFADTATPFAAVFPGYAGTASLRLARSVVFNNRLVYVGGQLANDPQWTGVGLWHTADFTSATQVPLAANENIWDLEVVGSELFALVSSPGVQGHGVRVSVRKTSDLSAWTEVLWFTAPSFARSFARLGGDWYFGLGASETTGTANAAVGDLWRTVPAAGPGLSASTLPLQAESFEQTAGSSLAGLAGGIGWGGPWTLVSGTGTVDAAGSSLPGGNAYGGRAKLRGTFSRAFSAPESAPGRRLWFLARIASENSAQSGGFYLGQSGSAVVTVLARPGSNLTLAGSSSGVLANGTRTLLGRVDLRLGGASVMLWVDPDLSLGEPDASTARVARGFPALAPDSVRISHSSSTSFYSYADEIRVASSFFNVANRADTPPPTPWETWLAAAALTPAELAAGLDAPDADLAGDGTPNLLKFALGHADARAPLPASLRPLASADASGVLALTFRRAQASVTYAVEASSDLAAWTTVATNPGLVGENVTVADPTPGPRRFLRLRVTLP